MLPLQSRYDYGNEREAAMWRRGWRERAWARLDAPWDILVVGGGITGAGIFRVAARAGLRVLLVERRDFAWGASSRSSKLVHGGLRYLAQGDVRLMWQSVRERERLLRAAPGLVSPLGFLLPVYAGERPGRRTYAAAIALYDAFGGRWDHTYHAADDFALLAPHLERDGLRGGFRYSETQTDDARLVLRLVREGVAAGGIALSYAAAGALLRKDGAAGRVIGVRLRDEESERVAEVRAGAVVNATGAWADSLRGVLGAPPRLRPLRGSHLIFPAWRLPVAQAIGFAHPWDRRPVFVEPWEGVTLAGTTDLDHERPLDEEPAITPAEVAYLLAGLAARFPSLDLRAQDAFAAYAGIRPVVSGGQMKPSDEPRDEAVWQEAGLLTVTGGKLTTFDRVARLALERLRTRFPALADLTHDDAPLETIPAEPLPAEDLPKLDPAAWERLRGRYATKAVEVLAAAHPGELEVVPGTSVHWAELRWAARAEGVVHLDDLLLRRVRLGLLLPEGGATLLLAIRAICQPELGWNDARWEAEEARYLTLWHAHYVVPAPSPDVISALPTTSTIGVQGARTHGGQAFPPRAALLAASAILIASGVLVWRARRRAIPHTKGA
jgi:glycerol-3-phosphate dehydrogenase